MNDYGIDYDFKKIQSYVNRVIVVYTEAYDEKTESYDEKTIPMYSYFIKSVDIENLERIRFVTDLHHHLTNKIHENYSFLADRLLLQVMMGRGKLLSVDESIMWKLK